MSHRRSGRGRRGRDGAEVESSSKNEASVDDADEVAGHVNEEDATGDADFDKPASMSKTKDSAPKLAPTSDDAISCG